MTLPTSTSDVLLSLSLAAIFIFLPQHDSSWRKKLWVAGWTSVFFYVWFGSLALVVPTAVTSALSTVFLQFSAWVFFASLTGLANRQKSGLLWLIAGFVPFLAYTLGSSFHVSSPWFYTVCLVTALSAGLLFGLRNPGQSALLSVYVAGWLFSAGLWLVYRVWRGATNEGLIFLPAAFLAATALFIPSRIRLTTFGLFSAIAGFLVWPAVLTVKYWGSFISPEVYPYARSEMLPFLLLAGGMIHLSLEQQRRVSGASEKRYQLLFEQTVVGIFESTVEGKILTCNESFARIFGHESPDAIRGNKIFDFFLNPIERQQLISRLFCDGYINDVEFEGRHEDGRTLWLLASIRLLPEDDLQPSSAMLQGTVFDISARKKAEREARDQADYIRALVENHPFAIVARNYELDVTSCNRAFEHLFQFANEDLAAHDLDELITFPEDARLTARSLSQRTMEGEPIHEIVRRKRKDGTSIDVEVYGIPVQVANRRIGHYALCQDITERLRTERKLKDNEELFRILFNQNAQAMCLVTMDSLSIRAVNRAALEIYGYSLEEFSLMNISTLWPADDWQRFLHHLQNGEPPHTQKWRHRAKHGNWIEVELQCQKIRVFDADHVLLTINDLSDHERAEQQIHEMRKLRSLGQMAGGMAHDFNNLLMGIHGNSELILHKANNAPAIKRHVDAILEATRRGTTMIQYLLAFSRKQQLETVDLDLNDLIQKSKEGLVSFVGEDISIEFKLCSEIGMVHADPKLIHEALIHLAMNAREAMPHGGRLTIETACVYLDESYVATHPGSAPGYYVSVTVADTGTGIAPDVLPNVFEPFFTTKDRARNAGLGLSAVYGFVRQSKGFITIESEPGKGTRCAFFIPRIVKTRALGAANGRNTGEQTATILLIEDDEIIRACTEEWLVTLGYSVFSAADGYQAIEIFAGKMDAIDLVLTDVILPGINGHKLAQILTHQRPGLKILYMSGHSDETVRDRGQLDLRGTFFLSKPFTLDSLEQKVQTVLRSGSRLPLTTPTTGTPLRLS